MNAFTAVNTSLLVTITTQYVMIHKHTAHAVCLCIAAYQIVIYTAGTTLHAVLIACNVAYIRHALVSGA